MAPEVMAGVGLGTAGDLYSLGVMLALLLCGHDRYIDEMCEPLENGADLHHSVIQALERDLKESPRRAPLHAALELCAELLSLRPGRRPTAAHARQSVFIRTGLARTQEAAVGGTVLSPAASATIIPPGNTVPKAQAAVQAPISTLPKTLDSKPRTPGSNSHMPGSSVSHTATSAISPSATSCMLSRNSQPLSATVKARNSNLQPPSTSSKLGYNSKPSLAKVSNRSKPQPPAKVHGNLLQVEARHAAARRHGDGGGLYQRVLAAEQHRNLPRVILADLPNNTL